MNHSSTANAIVDVTRLSGSTRAQFAAPVKKAADTIQSRSELVLSITQTASDFNGKVPQLTARMEEIVRLLTERNAPGSQIYLATRQMLLADRMLRRVAEILKGGDLAPYVKQGKLLPVDRAVSVVARAADALGYAHKQNVVHRDIKPANMMYHAETDTLKLTDFGIARLTDSSKTKTGMVLGTPSYMSPEQLAGKKIEGRSDLFSLAVSLYQMLSGKLPFEGESMAQLMFKIANEAPTDIRTHIPGLPPGLVAFLARAMAKNPDERYQSGEEFAQALRVAPAAKAN